MSEPTLYQWTGHDHRLEEALFSGEVEPVERCEHGKIDRHTVHRHGMIERTEWCPGAGIGDTEPCKGCGGQGWREGVEPDPRDETGMTPMQVQIQCECAGIGDTDDTD